MGWSFRKKEDMPSGLWMRCPNCQKMLFRKQVEEHLESCPECDEHFRITSDRRIKITADEGSFEEFGQEVLPRDFLGFKEKNSYADKLAKAARTTGMTEAVRVGFKHCYDEQDYQTIVDVAAKLPEQVIQEDEKLLMYYDVATMRLGE